MQKNHMIEWSYHMEFIAKTLTPEQLTQTTAAVQTNILLAYSKYCMATVPLRDTLTLVDNLILVLSKEVEVIGEVGVLNIVESAIGLQNTPG